jgi:hypothetical protein
LKEDAMSESTTPEVTPTEQQPSATDDKTLGEAGERALAAEREARKASDKRARDLERELNQFRSASMSEAEKAAAEAEARGRTTAITEFGQRLARSDFVAAAARRNPGFDATLILDDLNLARYVGEDGEPDSKAIEKAVERLIPTGSTEPAPLDLGVKRTVSTAPSMNDLIRKAAGRA